MRHVRFAALSAVLVWAAACGSSTPTSPTTTTNTPALFSGTLTTSGSSFFPFLATKAGTVSVTLATVTDDSGRPITPPPVLTLGFGNGDSAGTVCNVTMTKDVTPALVAQITTTVSAGGGFCANIADTHGNIVTSVNFGIRIVYP